MATKIIAKRPYRILSLDGGGVRAIIEVTILKRLMETYPELLGEVDVFTGASAGAIVGLAMATGLSPEDTATFWEAEVAKVFTDGWVNKVRSIDSTIGASYRTEELRETLERKLGNITLADIKKKVVVPSFNLVGKLEPSTPLGAANQHNSRWAAEWFHNYDHSTNADTSIVDVCMRTAAAPTYFPIYQGYVDGGTFANNPALAAVTTAVKSGVKLSDIVVLSISTGSNPKSIPKETIGQGNWGLVEWGPHIINLLLDSSTESINYQCENLLGEYYHRLDPILPSDISLDDPTSLEELKKVANAMNLDSTIKWINEHWKCDLEIMKITPLASQGGGYCSIQ